MARQRRSAAPARSAPPRPTAAPARPAAPQMQQQRPSSTAAAPVQTQQAPAQSSGGSSLFGQMAATAGGVAVGSSIGHAVGSFFTGGSSSAAPAETQQAAAAQPMDNSLYQANSTSGWAEDAPCAADARSFRKCMDDNRGDLTICGWYMDQLKACQQAAKPY
ncbi:hypothetical protein H112_07096 [Trichophyton rubrum D6]|uniref:CHCH domain-containing protein n=6 Tax=Trichophyton TaxID=5550 RepID=A0A178F2A4_TRIRU|nr:uncharacterized protein TERG_02430 [Trichophyton rubrum CBS 118892]EZF11881.1 hypothetical protein H100_07118 [Trichophyton rubrum MR850]EZF38775.1 hypothetical protein H102_07081 [Trichophyton rubrum CBS 100081]EZF49408.1 hypothetical protein H103_07102 [Trichophyton rubrum CBS 288.86]EZF60020.1 hypothetical protein H104_07058 [Trichophyton rubrum CBS 289.86]EZF70675.1 hypothetical protein H105_07115 [Trichophyton soudanense CBS 452.61]EZF81337.1 hypothetical protein H110_07098 [Trichophy